MNGTPPVTYLVAIPGTDQTQEYTRGNLLAALARGEITPDHWVWSAEHNDWVQISKLPALTPQASLPPPGRTFVPTQIGPVVNFPAIEPIRVPEAAKKKKKPLSLRQTAGVAGTLIKVILALAYLAAIGVIAANYVMVDQPFDAQIAKSPFVLVTAHAHLGSFVQQNALLIHVLPSPEITSDNLGDFLATLARSTPPQPFAHTPFQVVQLTSGIAGQYGFPGSDWAQLASMNNSNPEAEKDFVIDHLSDATGQPLLGPAKGASAPAREQVWQNLVAQFSSK
jgi:hypothetical protein